MVISPFEAPVLAISQKLKQLTGAACAGSTMKKAPVVATDANILIHASFVVTKGVETVNDMPWFTATINLHPVVPLATSPQAVLDLVQITSFLRNFCDTYKDLQMDNINFNVCDHSCLYQHVFKSVHQSIFLSHPDFRDLPVSNRCKSELALLFFVHRSRVFLDADGRCVLGRFRSSFIDIMLPLAKSERYAAVGAMLRYLGLFNISLRIPVTFLLPGNWKQFSWSKKSDIFNGLSILINSVSVLWLARQLHL